ncbi:glycosyltransferase family 2 protein [Enterococcus ureasiticus]|uniref:glycosyltransferase family 2 protein n=1 Tax=Enterococcus ureasiticus TaxID=903984 RepID=UPI001A8F057A|nr:glycosyltransferase family 2 protein [Enterococcus ureasiticus]MBO0472991.1 glycosyltransferase family 2 protein [Enterococcus ureasiticus]
MAKVSIIIPIYNVEDHLKKSIQSALDQTFIDFELIAVNDGSTDDSPVILANMAEMDSRIKVIDQSNQGVGGARNTGLSVAKGEYIYFADADDYLEKDLLEKVIDATDNREINLIVFGYKMIKNEKVFKTRTIKDKHFARTNQDFAEFFGEHNETIDMNSLWNKLYRRDFLSKNELWFSDKKIGEDAFFNYEIYETIDKVLFLDEVLYNYVIQRDGSAMSAFQGEQKIKDKISVMELRQTLLKKWGLPKLNSDILYINIIFSEVLSLSNSNESTDKKKLLREYLTNQYIYELIHVIEYKNLGTLKNKLKYVFCKKRILWSLINLL